MFATPPSRPALLLLMLSVLVGGAPALGQEQYTLGDDDVWEATGETADPSSPRGQLNEAWQALARRDYDEAERLATRWLERNERDPLAAEAYLVRGDALMGRRDYYDALFDYEFVARVFPGSEVFVTALEREYEIAHLFARGTKRKLWGLRIVDASDEAEELLIRIQERLPGSALAEQAGMELGDFYFRRGNMALAADAYDLFLENYPNSPRVTKARERLIYAYLASFKGPKYDAAGLYQARALLRRLQQVKPLEAEKIGASALLVRIDESDALKQLDIARWYLKTDDYIAAELTIRRLVKKYPRSVAATEAMKIIPGILSRLPAGVRAQAPDYDAFRAALLGVPASEATP